MGSQDFFNQFLTFKKELICWKITVGINRNRSVSKVDIVEYPTKKSIQQPNSSLL